MAFEQNTLLFGSDPTPRIVAIELGDTGTVKVYRREPDGSIASDIEPFHPFVWCDSDVTDLNIEAEKLAGDLRYALNYGEVRFPVLQQFLTDSQSEWSHKGEPSIE